MNQKEVKIIENRARLIMGMSPVQIKSRLKGRKLSILYFYILEDANFHNENGILTEMGVFGPFNIQYYPNGNVASPKSYGNDNAEKLWKEYRNAGGRTYDL